MTLHAVSYDMRMVLWGRFIDGQGQYRGRADQTKGC